MKKLIMIMAVAVAAAMPLMADTETVGGYTWEYRERWDGGVSIGSGGWSSYGSSSAVSPEPTGTLAIPSRLGGKPVTEIGSGAFYGYRELTSVTIPNTVKRIEGHAFDRCWNLNNVTIPDSVTYIDDTAFTDCYGLADEDGFLIVHGILFSYYGDGWKSEITIPDGVTRIAGKDGWYDFKGAFADCGEVESVRIPDSVVRIGKGAFDGCSAAVFDKTTIPGVKLVDGWAVGNTSTWNNRLSGALNLTGCRGIADSAFESCYDITSVTIPPSVKGIGSSAFYSCSGLQAVHITDLTAWLKMFAFGNGLDNPVKYAEHLYLNGKEVTDVVVPDGITDIRYRMFASWGGLKSVTIPNGVKNIDDGAFEYCKGLTSVTIPNSVTNIDDEAFCGCESLSSLVIPSSVKNIGWEAFADCDNLKKITLPTWCKKIKVYYDNDAEGYILSTKTVSGHDIWPVSFVFYAFCDDEDDDYKTYKVAEKQILRNTKITYKDVGGGSSGGAVAVAEMWKKAQTLDGAVFRDGKAAGVVQVKVGKASKNGEVAVSGTITGLDGKKLTAKGGKVAVNGESATATLAVKDGTAATVTIGKNGVSGSWNGAEIKSAEVGGNWTRTDAKVYVDAANLPAGTIEELLPDGEPVLAKGGKWAFNKGASVKLSKDKSKAEWDTSGGKSNLSSMKLTYTPKTGLFKGSFKVYALEAAKLKKYTANVTGVVVDGKGYGQATIKKPASGPWAVTVE